jgi:hypothetical protein
VVEILMDLDPAASRYGIAAHAAQLPERGNRWRPDCRYMSTTANPDRLASDVAPLVIEARAFVDGCVRALWSDGALSRDALRYPER